MSTLKVDTLTGVSTQGSIVVTGEGNTTTTSLQQGLAKAWISFNGGVTTPVAIDSFGTSTLIDNTTGDYSQTLTNAMGNANYCVVVMSYDDGSGSADGKNALVVAGGTADPSASAYNLYAHDNINSAEVDISINSCSINGDLA